MPAAWTVHYLVRGSTVTLVFIVAIAQGLMIPILALAALWLNYRQTDPALKTTAFWRACLWISAAAMVTVGIYQVITAIR